MECVFWSLQASSLKALCFFHFTVLGWPIPAGRTLWWVDGSLSCLLIRWPVPWAPFIFGEAQMDAGRWPSFAGKQRSCCPDPRGGEGVIAVSLVPDLGSHRPVYPHACSGSYWMAPHLGILMPLNALNTWPSVPKCSSLYPAFPLRENVLPSSTLTSLSPRLLKHRCDTAFSSLSLNPHSFSSIPYCCCLLFH